MSGLPVGCVGPMMAAWSRASFWSWRIAEAWGGRDNESTLDELSRLLWHSAREVGCVLLVQMDEIRSVDDLVHAAPWNESLLWKIADRVDVRGQALVQCAQAEYARRSLCAAIGGAGDNVAERVGCELASVVGSIDMIGGYRS